MKRFVLILTGIGALVQFQAQAATSTTQPFVLPTAISVSSTTAVAGVATVTIPAPGAVGPYSTGYYNYITHVRIEMYATSTLTGGATPVTCTSTNFPGTAVWKFPTAAATGSVTVVDQVFDNAIQSTSGNATTVISCPSTASVLWNIQVNYFQGN